MTTPGTTVWLHPAGGRRWRFDPGSLSLALGYTGDFGYGVPEWETLHSTADLDAWLTERFGLLARPADDADFAGARQLRSAIASAARRAAATRPIAPANVDTINSWASRLPLAPQLPGGTHAPSAASPAQALATIAQDAAVTFTSRAGMIRECAADDCRLVFLDSSRPQSRRWCSMNRCGGRAKSKSHYVRHSTGASL